MPSSSLVPTDPSVLLTTAGMQQFKPYFTGEKDPLIDFGSLNTVSIQKSFRTSDIDEVGDESHLTFFEMLGNFSFGGYFKKEAIEYAHEFITKELGLTIDYISVFDPSLDSGRASSGDILTADAESERIWKSLGVSNIKKFGRKDNFWGPTGAEGPCGPTTEIYVDGVEIWNIVFNEFYCRADKTLEPLKIKGVDTGMGLERLAVAVQNKQNVFETDLFGFMKFLPRELDARHGKIIADHLRASVFLLADGVRPANKDRGYILRRLLRRVFVYNHVNKLSPSLVGEVLAAGVIDDYDGFYNELGREKANIIEEIYKEKDIFEKTLARGLKELEKTENIDTRAAFNFYQSFGLPFEIIKEFGGLKASELTLDGFNGELEKHREVSRAGAEKKFGGHGLATGDLTAANPKELKIKTRLHTATHLLNAALHKVLGDQVSQKGSDITAERARFDFSFNRKLMPEEIKRVEDLVNGAIAENYPVTAEVMDLADAKKSGALYFGGASYPDRVKVYSIGPSSDSGSPFSRELCGGPHVERTGELGRFRITKEEASSAGVRRMRIIVE